MKKQLRVIFAGTPGFAEAHLRTLVESRHQLVAVFTQPDRPAGRGRKLERSLVKKLALQCGLPVYQPGSLKNTEAVEQIRALEPDLMVVVAYGLLLPADVLTVPRYGCINVHASLLPRWRGAAPIQRAIAAGDTESGITIMQMDEGLDTGDVLLGSHCAVLPDDTSASLQERLARLGQPALTRVLDAICDASIQPVKQQDALSTYAPRISKQEARLDWSRSAVALDSQVRAFNPWPVAWFMHRVQKTEQPVRVWEAAVENNAGRHEHPGTVIQVDSAGIRVACGTGTLCIKRLQLPGGRALDIKDLLNSRRDLFVSGQLLDGCNLPASAGHSSLQTVP
ncbi:MAG: methionyl-tRNA formyltransferase [Kistimonas sp.]|nr:methionyl-tRNA formyltransferase [Kistimonas sp.]